MTDAPRVLIADAQPTARASLRRLLVRSGFEVCAEVASAGDAIAGAGREDPALCVLDVLLPGDGIAAVAEISARGVAVVVFTASNDRRDLLGALRAGAAGYLLKGMDPKRLPHVLRGVLGGEAAIPRELMASLVDELRSSGLDRIVVGRTGPAELTKREGEIAELLVEGLSTNEIAARLGLSPVTVRRHVSSIVAKLGVGDRAAAVALLTDAPA